MSNVVEISVDDDEGGGIGATFRVLADGRLQVETDDLMCTLPLTDSRAIADAILRGDKAGSD